MNRLIYIVASLFIFINANAQFSELQSVKTTKGDLKNQLSHEEWSSVKTLKVKGELNSEDFSFLRSLAVSNLDLSGISNKTLPAKALQGCRTLESVILPDNMVSLGVASFMHCSSLKNVQLPKKLNEIHSLAFSECSALSDVTIPKNTNDINAGAFYACTNLKSFNVESGNSKYKSIDGIIYSTDSAVVVCPAGKSGTVIIADFASEIENAAFGGCDSINVVLLPNSVVKIGDGAFWSCKSLKTLHLPDSLKTLGKGVFLGSGLSSISWNENIKYIPTETFKNCLNLTTISLPLGIDSIGNNAFQGCANLSNIVIPSSIRSIGSCSFQGCISLKHIDLPSNLTLLGQDAFSSSSVEAIVIPQKIEKLYDGTFAQCESLKTIQIPNGVKSIGNSCFMKCSSLSSIVLPNSVTEIGESAFCGSAIEKIEIPEGVVSIKKCLFKNCKSLKSVKLSSKTVEIEEEAFLGTSISSIDIPNGVVGIADGAFKGCQKLSSVSLPSNLMVIGSNAFADCDNISSIQSPAGNPPRLGVSAFSNQCEKNASLYVTEESKNAYKGNSSWSKFDHVLGNYVLNVTRPGLMSFMITDSLWTSLQNLKITGTISQKDIIFLSNLMHRGCQLRVLDMTEVEGLTDFGLNIQVKKYNNQANNLLRVVLLPLKTIAIDNNAFAGFSGLERVSIPQGTKKIGSHAFENCTSLCTIVLPDDIEEIGDYSFSNCKSLKEFSINNKYFKSVKGILYTADLKCLVAYPQSKEDTKYEMPNTVESMKAGACVNAKFSEIELSSKMKEISDSAFACCSNLVNVTIPENIESIGNSAFLQDTSLAMLIVSEGVNRIGISAFQSCSNLQSVDLASSVSKIGDYAFWDCKRIENFTNRALEPQTVKSNVFPKHFMPNCGNLFIEQSGLSAYKKSPAWSKFSKIESLSIDK